MSARFKIVVLLAAVIPLAALSQDQFRLKPGARGKLCLECHVAFRDTVARPFVHTPVKSGNCSDCHSPHASEHGKMLADTTSAICAECHGDIAPSGAVSTHQALVDGECTTCHDPHGSSNKNNLLESGNQLCFGCHDEIASGVSQAAFKHDPVGKGCINCHDPHASTAEQFLLKQEVSSLCGSCHRTDQPSFSERHMGYPVAASRCTSCHDPHGSSNAGILWADVHKPVTNKMCSQCHQDPGSSNALATKRPGAELCRACHSGELNTMRARNRLHWPVTDRTACLNCHSPHASKQSALLKQPMKQLCGSCHPKAVARQEASLTKHAPIDDGQCSVCHAPHASDNVLLLEAGNVIDLCGMCHEWKEHSTHPLGDKVVDLRNPNLNVDCQSCHQTHGSEFKAFTHADSGGDLCVQCHSGQRR